MPYSEVIQYVNILLFVLILILTGTTNNKAVLIYCSITSLSSIALFFIPDIFGTIYYYSIGVSDYIIIHLLTKMPPTSLVIKLQRVCKLFIIINSLGWVMWMKYEPPTLYNGLCTILYIYTILVIFKHGDIQYVGDIKLDSWKSRLFSYNSPCDIKMQRDKEETNT